MNSRILAFGIWTLGLAAAVAFNLKFQGQSESFRGIADTLETVITTESVSEIAKIHVAPGQTVRSGDTLVQLTRPDLDQRMEQIRRERQHVQGQTQASATDLDRRVNEVQAALETRRSQIRLEIRQLQELNRRSQDLARRLQVSGAGAASDTSAAQIQVRGLEHELALAESSARSQIQLLRGSRGTQSTGGVAQSTSFSAEARLLEEERSRLVLLAPQDGVIGSVFFREHDKVNAFAPIVSMMAQSPSIVHGYLQENIAASLVAGDSVAIRSTIHAGLQARGHVVGLGTRIVEMPVRLRKVPTLPVWGREVTIRLPPENRFLLGELVSITPLHPARTFPGWLKP